MSKFDGKNYKASPQSLANSALPQMPTTPSSFDTVSTDDVTNQTRTSYTKIRSYDVVADKIDIKIAGTAPIFGSNNGIESYTWANDSKANYTGSLNEVYATQDFKVPALMYRKININYAAIDMAATKDQKAVSIWEKNITKLMNELEAAVYRDLKIFEIRYAANQTDESILSATAAAFHSYQVEIQAFLTTLISFQYLVAVLPKLAELYPNAAIFLNYIQNKLRTTKYTALVRSMMIDLKRRYVDKTFFKAFNLPATMYSQSTDGINSPIIYLVQQQKLEINKFRLTGSEVEQWAIHTYSVSSDYRQTRTLDAFSLDTVLSLVLDEGSYDDHIAKIDKYLETALASLVAAQTALVDFALNPVVQTIETALAKLATAPGATFNWSQNIEFNELRNIDRLSKWEFVEQMFYFSAATPDFNDNGYTLKVPMFRKAGLSKQMMLEYFQLFYIKHVAYINMITVGDEITIRFRNRKRVSLVAKEENKEISFVLVGTSPDITMRDVMTGFAEQFPRITVGLEVKADRDVMVAPITDADTKRITLTNPELMTYITYSIVNRSADIEVWLTQNFIISLA